MRTCNYCTSEFQSTRKGQRHCGASTCSNAYRSFVRKRYSWQLTCQACGGEYKASRKDGKYCHECRGAATSTARSPENIEIYTAMRSGTNEDALTAIQRRCTPSSAGCWEWQGFRSPTGYGYISTGRTKARPQELAHRLVYEYATGVKPEGMTVHHKCANPACCNPDHLQLATQRDNMAEMHARKTYEAQIADLRKALSKHDPKHPLLVA